MLYRPNLGVNLDTDFRLPTARPVKNVLSSCLKVKVPLKVRNCRINVVCLFFLFIFVKVNLGLRVGSVHHCTSPWLLYHILICFALLYKVPSKSTGKKLCYKRILLLPVEFVTKYFFKVFDP